MHCQDKGYKIRCNSVHPGGIETPMLRTAAGRGEARLIPDGVLPVGALGAAKDVAHMVLYLASPEARFVNAAEFVIDNGNMFRPAQAAAD
jgi:3(or 17)beta-hydroxysteroid dehydrogenase